MDDSTIWFLAGMAFLGVIVFALIYQSSKKRQLREHLDGVASEIGLHLDLEGSSYSGNIKGWPVRLEITQMSAIKSDAMQRMVEMAGLVQTALGNFQEARIAHSAGRSKKEAIALTIDGTARPQELERLAALAKQWEMEAEGWTLLVCGNQWMRWLQDVRFDQSRVRGMPVIELLAKTLAPE
jgi:hypothetical protein